MKKKKTMLIVEALPQSLHVVLFYVNFSSHLSRKILRTDLHDRATKCIYFSKLKKKKKKTCSISETYFISANS